MNEDIPSPSETDNEDMNSKIISALTGKPDGLTVMTLASECGDIEPDVTLQAMITLVDNDEAHWIRKDNKKPFHLVKGDDSATNGIVCHNRKGQRAARDALHSPYILTINANLIEEKFVCRTGYNPDSWLFWGRSRQLDAFLGTAGILLTLACASWAWHCKCVPGIAVLIALWAIIPPAAFWYHHYFHFRVFGRNDRFDIFKYGEQVSGAVWAGMVVVLLFIGASDRFEEPDAKATTVEQLREEVAQLRKQLSDHEMK